MTKTRLIAALLAAATALAAPSAMPALAQFELPRTSPAEREVQMLNRDLALQRSLSEIDRQHRFDHQMLRQRLHRLETMPQIPPPQMPRDPR